MNLSPEELRLCARERRDYDDLLAAVRDPLCRWREKGLEITCIGNTGGAASVVSGEPCGGFLLRHAGRTAVIDPGDNSIAQLVHRGFNPFELTDVLASHAHNDHVGDLSLAVSAAIRLGLLPEGQSDACVVVAPSLIDYSGMSSTKFGFTLPAFAWQARVEPLYWQDARTLRFDGTAIPARREVRLSADITVSAAEARHGQVMVTGFVIGTSLGRIGYTSDTEYFDGLASWFAGVDVLWLNMNTLMLDAMVPDPRLGPAPGRPVHNHLGYEGVCRLIAETRPKTAIVSHLGAQLLGQRLALQQVLRQRFEPDGIAVHCPANWDSFHFGETLSSRPDLREFRP